MKQEIKESKLLIETTEKELHNLVNFLRETGTELFLKDEYTKIERQKQFEKYKNSIAKIMIKKAEKMNSLRRNSFAYINKTHG